MLNKLAGKKTYIAAAIAGAVAVAQALGYEVPEYALPLLAAFGLYGVRNAIGR